MISEMMAGGSPEARFFRAIIIVLGILLIIGNIT